MADIDVQRRSGAGWLWWLLGLIVLGLIIWALTSAFDRGEPEAGTVTPASSPEVVSEPATAPGATPETPVPAGQTR